MINMEKTITAKSDQLNADDLVGGAITITIQDIKAIESDKQQPIAIFYGDPDGKSYKPCKSMRKMLVAIWGKDGSQYVGRSMTLYRDPSVTWGGVAVGGIRISHMTHMDSDTTIVLSASKTKKKAVKIQPLVIAEPDNMAALSELFAGNEPHINAYLLSLQWITEGGTYHDLNTEQVNRIMNNQGGFLSAANTHNPQG